MWIDQWTNPSRYKIAYGGRGSGKSWGIARLLLWAAQKAPIRVLCAREYQASIADSVHRLLSAQIMSMKPEHAEQFSILRNEITHANGSQFFFVAWPEIRTA